jgi:tripartite tricarboxylate transporter TctB family protein
MPHRAHAEKAPLGADLVIPLLALAFAAYFFVSIADLAWEAKANGMIIGTLLVLLIVVQLIRIGLAVVKGRANLRTDILWQPREVLGKRIAMVAVTIAFIATIQWLGLTLGLLLGMAAALWAMGVRGWKVNLAISTLTAAAAYALFIAALDSNFPHGPIERLLAGVF